MELFTHAKAVRLKSRHDKFLYADEDELHVTQDRNGSSPNARWTVETVPHAPGAIRLRSRYGRYLAASGEAFLLGMTGRKVLQVAPAPGGRPDASVEWEPVKDGFQARFKSRAGAGRGGGNVKYLRANGGVPPWRNSVSHDVPHRSATQDWVLWDVEIVQVLTPAATPGTGLGHAASAPATALQAPESPSPPKLRPAPTPHEAHHRPTKSHPTPPPHPEYKPPSPPHPEYAPPPPPTAKPEPKLSKLEMRSEPYYMSLQHLKEITTDFSEEKILGRGGSCVVYKGEHDGELIAVKKVEQRWTSEENSKKAKKQFKNEVKLLMKIKHPNIVELLGHCYETHSAPFSDNGTHILLWQIDCLLCLEFLPESLNNHISDATSGLDWHTRYKIIEGISNGLQYLHEKSPDPIMHMDLKPGNILLNANMVPKVTDFGISRLYEQGHTIHTKITPGTLGYMPPEYIRDGIITPKYDIFSLGVIIIEVITGHRNYPLDLKASSKEFVNTELSKWRSMLGKEPGNTNIETDCQDIEKCIQIGLMCLNPDRTKRPTMRNITNFLQGLESTTTE